MAELAEPSQAILTCLEELASDPHNAVYIISGRNKNRLQVCNMKVTLLSQTINIVKLM